MRRICGVVVGALVLSAPAVAAAQGVALADSPPNADRSAPFANVCMAAGAILGKAPVSCGPSRSGPDY